jgi:lysine 6-dehydrogenase
MKAVVFGCGLVGGAMVRDLAKDREFEVTAIDANDVALKTLEGIPGVTTQAANLHHAPTVGRLAREHDIAVLALPGHMGFQSLAAIIEAGRNVVDISFMPEDPTSLHDAAKQLGVIAITDCGVAPGLSHALAAHATTQLDTVKSIAIYVGGLPRTPEPPWNYRVVFSAVDVLEEYTRPARIMREGKLVLKDALTEVEQLDFAGVGKLEAFISDGLRSLVNVLKADEMVEKTLRYPGHADKMRALREAGLFGKGELEVRGGKVRPLDVAAALLFPQWKMREGEEDVTVMRVAVNGVKDGGELAFTYDMLDAFDREGDVSSMARTTGYTGTSAVRLIRDGVFARKGVSTPEYLGLDDACFTALMGHLAKRGVVVSGV